MPPALSRGNQRDSTLDQIGRQRRQSGILVLCPSIFDRHLAEVGEGHSTDEAG
jgi:hypothetical protein